MSVSFHNKFVVSVLLTVFIGIGLLTISLDSYAQDCSSLKDSTFTEKVDFNNVPKMYECALGGDDYLKSYLQGLFFSGLIDFTDNQIDLLRSPVEDDDYSLLKSYFINASRPRGDGDKEDSIEFLIQSAKLGNPYAGYLASARYIYEDGHLADAISHFSYNYSHRYGMFFFSMRRMIKNGCYDLSRLQKDSVKKGFYYDPHFLNFIFYFRNSGCIINDFDMSIGNYFYLPINDYIKANEYSNEFELLKITDWIREHKRLDKESPLIFCDNHNDSVCSAYAFYDDFYCKSIITVRERDVFLSPEYKKCREIFLIQHKPIQE